MPQKQGINGEVQNTKDAEDQHEDINGEGLRDLARGEEVEDNTDADYEEEDSLKDKTSSGLVTGTPKKWHRGANGSYI